MVRRPSILARRLQWVLLGSVLLLVGAIIRNAAGNLAARHLGFSFDYLWQPANFEIPFHVLSWVSSNSYGRVLLVGLCNTLLVSVFGIVGASLLGVLVGVMRLSVNGLLRLIATCFVELVRNTPQLVQIVFWYVAVLQALPSPRQSIVIPPGLLLNVRGLYVPWPVMTPTAAPFLAVGGIVVVLGVAAVVRWDWRWTWLLVVSAGLFVLPIQQFDWPVVGGFNVRGGAGLPPEFVALWLGLTTYSAAFIAEIVRGAVQAVPHGQVEAAQALGLRPFRVLGSVILPQAVRMMVPPLTSQYLNLVKSSSLGAAIAFPEIFQIFGGTALNQSGREIETMSLIIAVFLAISLTISTLMNAYHRWVGLPKR
jgi:general L-amino acid transport system permease protein